MIYKVEIREANYKKGKYFEIPQPPKNVQHYQLHRMCVQRVHNCVSPCNISLIISLIYRF